MSENKDSIPNIKFKHVIFRFDKKLESEFYTDFFQNSLGFIRVTHILSMFLFAIFGILDMWMLPESKFFAWFIRYAIICPVILVCFFFTYMPFYKKIMQFSLMLKCLLTGFGFAVMIALMQETEPGFNYYYVCIMLVIIACHVLLRIRFVNATIISWIILCAYEIVAIYFHHMLSSPGRISIFLNNNFFLISMNIMGMIGSFFIEYFIRNDFLLRKRIMYEEEQKTYKTKAELLKTKLERDYAQQAIFSIELETDAGLRNIAHSIKNKHMIQEVRNKSITKKINILNDSIRKLNTDIPNILNKACSAVINKYQEKILEQIKIKLPELYKKFSQHSNGFFFDLKKQIITAFENKNAERINNFLVTNVIRNKEDVCRALDDSFNHMLDILNYIYAIIAYQRGKAVQIKGNVSTDLGRIYWLTSRTYRKELAKYNIAFKYENHTGEDVSVRIYDFILEEDVIRNLFINSFRALVVDDPENKRKDKTIWIEVYLKPVDSENQFYIIHFRDNGPGIKEDKKKAIFEGYTTKQREYIVSQIKTEVEHGVGLRTAKKRIEEAGGSIHEEGFYGDGANFIIILNRYKKESPEKEAEDLSLKDEDVSGIPLPQGPFTLFANKKLLIVDDDKPMAIAIGNIFEETGLQIMYAQTIDEARDRIYDIYIKPDVIILDLDLGGQRGENILIELIGKKETIPVVVVSGSDRVFNIERLKRLQAHSIFPKPVNEQKLYNAIKDILIKKDKNIIPELIYEIRTIPDTCKEKIILIIDDEPEARNAIAKLFSGLRILFAVNNREAMSKITEFQPHVIALDLALGADNGRDLLKWMNQSGNQIPTVVVSGELEDEDDKTAKELIELGALKTHPKPFNENKLFADVISIIK